MKKKNQPSSPIQMPKVLAMQKQEETKELYTTVKHMANLGDVISIMPAIKRYWEVTGRRVQILQMINVEGHYYMGATHPTKSEDGKQVTMNMKMYEMLKPLVESQPYIHSIVPFQGQKVDLDFDVIRGQTDVGMPNFMIQCWVMFAFPDLDYDLSTTWVDLPENYKNKKLEQQVKGKIIINFTERYRNGLISYHHLRQYAPELIFAGTEVEHFKFCNQFNLNIPRLEIKNFLEYAYAIKWARFIVCNQSFGWNLSTAMGTPRLLEVCKFAPNCQPYIGPHSKGYLYQVGAEYYFRRFYQAYK